MSKKRQLRPSTWTGGGPRVLIEEPDAAIRGVIADELSRRGFATSECSGPAGPGSWCPLSDGWSCAAAEGADVVVHRLDPADRPRHAVHCELQRREGGAALVVLASRRAVRDHSEALEGCTVLSNHTDAGTVGGAVEMSLTGAT